MEKPLNAEAEQLQQRKTELLKELHINMQEENKAVLEKNIVKLEQLTERAAELMGRIDEADARLRKLVKPILEEQDEEIPLTDEQKWLIMEMKQLHKQVMGELIRQRTTVVEQMKELREADNLINLYKKEFAIEGAFVNQKK